MGKKTLSIRVLIAGVALLGLSSGCDREKGESAASKSTAPRPPEVVVFPVDLRVPDESVNEFVAEAMQTCVSSEYEPFRLLFSAEHEPISREQFEYSWQAISKITIKALEHDRARDSYAVYAEVDFIPDMLPPQHELHQNPRREVVLLIIREHEQWRLARAPKAVQTWIIEQCQDAGDQTAPQGTPAPATPSG